MIISFNDSHCRQQIHLLKGNYKLLVNLRKYRAVHSLKKWELYLLFKEENFTLTLEV